MKSSIKFVTAEIFKQKFLSQLPVDFKWQKTPVQIYPFELISQYILSPTPILKSDHHYIVYLNRGEYRQQVGNETYLLKAPSVIFAPEGTPYAIKALNKKLSGFYIQIENKVISSIISKGDLLNLLSRETVLKLTSPENVWIQSICNLLYEEVSLTAPNIKIGRGLLQALLHKLIELSPGKKDITRQRKIAIEFKQLLNKHFVEQKSVSFYANKLSISENYLNRCVKSEYNKSCKKLILETAVSHSELLLLTSSMDISEISFQVGFHDPSHFSRIFKKISGRTPSEFKNQITHGLS